MTVQTLLRSIPKVDELMRAAAARLPEVPLPVLTGAVRDTLSALRGELLAGQRESMPSTEELVAAVAEQTARRQRNSLRPLINGTGVVLHTNLGRAPLAEAAAEAAYAVGRGYSTLEYDLERGRRGSRYSHVEGLLCQLTGAESALVVNNNAAAVLLILTALGKGREAVVSRGELVEIGGSFRIPDVMESCGCILREVGATNKTHLSDYEKAIGENCFALLKVHTSNFRILGFTESVSREELAELAHSRGLPLIEDLGSGALLSPALFGAADEPDVAGSVRAGVDLVSFSGDKLLGGPQAGVIVGRKELVDKLKAHPLNRALRIDKLTLAALEATLRLYAEGRAQTEIPTLSMLTAENEALREKAETLVSLLRERGVSAEVTPLQGQVGGGSAPAVALSSFGAAILHEQPNALASRLQQNEPPVIGRVAEDRFCLDVRTLFDGDLVPAADAVREALA